MNQLSDHTLLIDVEDLPAPVGAALETLVETIRDALDDRQRNSRVTLPTRKGSVTDDLSRDIIHG